MRSGQFAVGLDDKHQGMRLICVPFAGAGAAAFTGWQSQVENVNVVTVRLPGRESRLSETPYNRMEPLINDLYRELGPILQQPVALFGHSLGGLIAFELARRCQAEGYAPVHLFISGCEAPPRRDPYRRLHLLPDTEFLAEIADLGGTPSEVLADRELLSLVVPVLRADYEVYETYCYRPGSRLQCPITACGGDADPEVSMGDLQRWQKHTVGRFAVRVFTGGHFYLQPCRKELLAVIGSKLHLLRMDT